MDVLSDLRSVNDERKVRKMRSPPLLPRRSGLWKVITAFFLFVLLLYFTVAITTRNVVEFLRLEDETLLCFLKAKGILMGELSTYTNVTAEAISVTTTTELRRAEVPEEEIKNIRGFLAKVDDWVDPDLSDPSSSSSSSSSSPSSTAAKPSKIVFDHLHPIFSSVLVFPRRLPVSTYTVEEVKDFLLSKGLPLFAAAKIAAEDIDGMALFELEGKVLDDLRLSVGHKITLTRILKGNNFSSSLHYRCSLH